MHLKGFRQRFSMKDNKLKTLKKFNFFGTKKEEIIVTEKMKRLARDSCLPPKAPEPISENGEKDVSLFTSTFNMEDIKEPLDEQRIKFWLPLGFDIYVVALQSMPVSPAISKLAERLRYHLETPVELGEVSFTQQKTYIEYKHVERVTGSKGNGTFIALYIFVEESLVKEQNFQLHGNSKVSLPQTETTLRHSGSDALIVNFRIFDTLIQVINVQLTRGKAHDHERQGELDAISQRLREDYNDVSPDHVFMLGDFATTFIPDLENSKLYSFIVSKLDDPTWNPKRFQDFFKLHDELKSMKEQKAVIEDFKEIQVSFPPTNKRKPCLKPTTEETVAQIFAPGTDLDDLFNYTDELPCYPDRILFQTVENAYRDCLKPGKTGTCEGVRMNEHVPVFSTFRVGNRSLGGQVPLSSPQTLQKKRQEPHEMKKVEIVEDPAGKIFAGKLGDQWGKQPSAVFHNVPIKVSPPPDPQFEPYGLPPPSPTEAEKQRGMNKEIRKRLEDLPRKDFSSFRAHPESVKYGTLPRSEVGDWDDEVDVDEFPGQKNEKKRVNSVELEKTFDIAALSFNSTRSLPPPPPPLSQITRAPQPAFDMSFSGFSEIMTQIPPAPEEEETEQIASNLKARSPTEAPTELTRVGEVVGELAQLCSSWDEIPPPRDRLEERKKKNQELLE